MGGSSTARLPVALIEIAWFAKDWEGIEQVFRLERTARILKTDQMRHEVVYGREPSLDTAGFPTTHALVGQRSLGHREEAALSP